MQPSEPCTKDEWAKLRQALASVYRFTPRTVSPQLEMNVILAGLLAHSFVLAPSHCDATVAYQLDELKKVLSLPLELTAAGTAPDSHRIPF